MVHQFTYNNNIFVIDVYSGAVLEVEALFSRLISYLGETPPEQCPETALEELSGEYPREDILECYQEILALFHQGQLFSPDDYDRFADKMVASPIKAMCLNVSHDCNLRCEYCFAGKGDYQQGRMVMDANTGKKAIDYLIANSGNRQYLEVDFFGGEPLMNFGVVKQVVAYARSLEKTHNKEFRFTITTNGMLLDDHKIEYINREMSNVVLSLDGRKSTNDRVRTRVDGSGCYEAIVPKFQKLVESRGDKEYYVRGTFTKYNKDFAEDVMALNRLGFDQISIEPVVSDPSLPYSLTEDDFEDVFAEYDRLAGLISQSRSEGKWFNFFHFMVDLDQGPCAIKRLRGCGCGNEYLAVTPDGDVYPCHQFIGHDQWKMGNVYDGSLNQDMKNRFSHTTVYDKADCRECWAKFYCSGGCNANNMQYEGDILKSHKLSCDMLRKRLECAIALRQLP